jgi:Heterokaryon incompatibility protein (HET)
LTAQRFHLEYLWIDSLCILQDDKIDWQRESANMARVYQNSYLTIAATRSADGMGGCFSHSKDAIIEGIANGIPYKICATIEQPHVLTLESGEHYQSHHWDSYPLLRRGWVYQERLLSPRVLHYGPFELFWECRTETTCECTGIKNAWWKEAWKDGPHLPQLKLSHSQALLTSDLSQLYQRWHVIVEQYSKRQLSKPNDRLPALSGLAKQMLEHRRTDKYLAGIWEQSLHFDLLWTAEIGARRSRDYRAPSWSWASVDGFIHYDIVKTPASIALKPVCKILFTDTISAYNDPTGEITSGQMDVAGVLLEATLEVQILGDIAWHPLLNSELKSSKWVNYRIWLYGVKIAGHETKSMAVDHDLLSLMSEPRFMNSPERVPVIRCLRVAIRRAKAYYLVLARIHGEDEKYERIGVMDHDQRKRKCIESNEIERRVTIL